ncbi:MAG: hypothetical protein HKO09_09445 [Croceitalea sp.]|nr:hypothetical protein [Croceitalea sp.]
MFFTTSFKTTILPLLLTVLGLCQVSAFSNSRGLVTTESIANGVRFLKFSINENTTLAELDALKSEFAANNINFEYQVDYSIALEIEFIRINIVGVTADGFLVDTFYSSGGDNIPFQAFTALYDEIEGTFDFIDGNQPKVDLQTPWDKEMNWLDSQAALVKKLKIKNTNGEKSVSIETRAFDYLDDYKILNLANFVNIIGNLNNNPFTYGDIQWNTNLYFLVDGVVTDEAIVNSMDQLTIDKIYYYEPDHAKILYGDGAKDGAVVIYTK